MLEAALRSGAAVPPVRLRGLRPPAARGPPLRRGRRHRPAARRDRALPLRRRRARRTCATRRGRRARRWTSSPATASTATSGGMPRASATSPARRCSWSRPTSPTACVLETLVLQHPQPRQRRRRRRLADDVRRRRPALHRDGLAAHPRGGGGRRRPRGIHRRVRHHLATSRRAAGYGVPTAGTAAHAFTLLHDDEREAFAAQIASLGKGTTLLVDTYDVPTRREHRGRARRPRAGRRAARLRRPAGPGPRGARPARPARAPPTPGSSSPRDLDEYAIAGARGRAGGPLRRGHVAGHRLRRPDRRDGLQAGRPRPTTPATMVGRGEEEQGQGVGGRPQVRAAPAAAPGASPRPRCIGIGAAPADDGDDRALLVAARRGRQGGRAPRRGPRGRPRAAPGLARRAPRRGAPAAAGRARDPDGLRDRPREPTRRRVTGDATTRRQAA